MRLSLHADDAGLAPEVTAAVLEAYDAGAIDATSVVANGPDTARALAALAMRPKLRVHVHLDLLEGRPLTSPGPLAELLEKDGRFQGSFVRLWGRLARGAPALAAAVRDELRAQILLVRSALGSDCLARVDGHRHVHMIPGVLDALLDVHSELSLAYVRLPAEPMFLSVAKTSDVVSYAGPNAAKHLLLRALSARAKRMLSIRGVDHNDHFVGLLFTGRMSARVVRAALSRLETVASPRDRVEVLFHPGMGGEAWRERERSELLGAELARVTKPHRDRASWDAS